MSDLQVKIFTRWVNQKLVAAKFPSIPDTKTGFADGTALVNLIEALSEEKFPGKPLKAGISRMAAMDQLQRAMDFVKSVGVENKLPPSNEDLADGAERPIMGMIWSIMQRFLKFGDDEDEQKLSAEDSLLMWAQNQTQGYDGVEIKSFTKSFHNGLAYGALIHKNRPKFLDPKDLTGSNDENLQKVLDAATRYFDLEQYITPAEIQKLDAKSAFIFLSEFYYGIARMRKVDLSCRRISKLVTYTKINDALRADYKAKSETLVANFAKVNAVLGDKTIDNTMAGAKAKLAEFASYKQDDKPNIIEGFLGCESVFNQLAMRLNDHHRPAFVPPEGHDVPSLREALKKLEETEKERQLELVAELNRQIKLAQLNVQHQARFDKLSTWSAAKSTYLGTKEEIASSGDALYQINVLNAYNEESKVIQASVVVELTNLGAELVKEKFEHSAAVQEREATNAATFTKLGEDSATKMKVLEDDLARMRVKEATDLVNLKHIAKAKTIGAWQAEKEAYLGVTEDINSVADAQLHLSVLDMYDADQKDMTTGMVEGLKAVGKEILAAEYKSDLSSWKFDPPAEVTDREAAVDSKMEALTGLSATKRGVLDAALASEIEKERLRLLFATQAGEFTRWSASLVEDLPAAHFGFNLQEVEAYKAKLDAEDAEIKSTSATKTETYTKTSSDAEAAGVKDNKYTTLTLAQLGESAAALEAAQAARVAAYEKELERVRYNDGLCKKFADIANPLSSSFDANKEAITAASGELEPQIATTTEKLGEEKAHSDKVAEAKGVQTEMDERKVEYNPHTHLNAKDLDVLFQQYIAFLTKKQAQLQEELDYKAMRGLTKEQFAEIETQFKQFDKSGDGKLSKSEFKSCLFSLGEEKSSKEVTEQMNKYGSEAGIEYEGFKEFMISQLGDTDTKPEILEGWELINKGAEVAKVDLMKETILRDEDVTYMQETAPKVGDDYDYKAWTEDVFSR